jgi:hypothetical protein
MHNKRSLLVRPPSEAIATHTVVSPQRPTGGPNHGSRAAVAGTMRSEDLQPATRSRSARLLTPSLAPQVLTLSTNGSQNLSQPSGWLFSFWVWLRCPCPAIGRHRVPNQPPLSRFESSPNAPAGHSRAAPPSKPEQTEPLRGFGATQAACLIHSRPDTCHLRPDTVCFLR